MAGRVILGLLLAITVFVIFELIISKYWLTTSHYEISTDCVSQSIRIVQLSDLHNSKFGKDNKRLVEKVRKEEPDLILITGDLLNAKTDEGTEIAENLIRSLKDVAPVYVSYGNHEKDFEEKSGQDLTQVFTAAGATVLERSYVDIEINGQPIRLGGIYGYCQTFKYAQENKREDESAFLLDFQNTERYTILMAHMPICWLEGGSLCDWDVDLVFSGHTHGGQVRIPGKGGLWAPDQGWFPGKLEGVYTTTEQEWQETKQAMYDYGNPSRVDNSYYEQERVYKPSYLVLSRGLGSTEKIPRFNNVPEIVVTDVVPDVYSVN